MSQQSDAETVGVPNTRRIQIIGNIEGHLYEKVVDVGAVVLRTEDDGRVTVLEAPEYAEADYELLRRDGIFEQMWGDCFCFGTEGRGEGVVYYEIHQTISQGMRPRPLVLLLRKINRALWER